MARYEAVGARPLKAKDFSSLTGQMHHVLGSIPDAIMGKRMHEVTTARYTNPTEFSQKWLGLKPRAIPGTENVTHVSARTASEAATIAKNRRSNRLM